MRESFQYVRISENSAQELMEQINHHGKSGYKLLRWYESSDNKTFLAVMEKRNYAR